ncbi:MAG: VWA domain-containing protein [Acidimicrobiia bacterium]
MTFLEPARLLLLVLPVAGFLAYLASLQRREQYAVRFTNLALLDKVAPETPGWRRHAPAAVLLVGVVALVLAVAKPAVAIQVPRDHATVILAIDVSLSMEADDVSPTRIEAAREAARNFLELAPPELEVGIVAFSGSAAGILPPTVDRTAARGAIDRLSLDEGTAIGEGIHAAVEMALANRAADAADEGFGDGDGGGGEAPAEAIIVLSDGETTMGRPDLAGAAEAADADIPVSTVSFGTDDGIVFIQGEGIPVPANEGALDEVASTTGGEFFTAATGEELQSILDTLGSQVAVEEEQREVTDWFAGAGLALILLAATGSLLWFSRIP